MSIPMHIVIAYNDSTNSSYEISDLGISIADSTAGVTLSDFYTYCDLAESDDLRQAIEDGDIRINNGITDLSAVEGVKYLTIIQQDYLEDNYYDTTELGTSGQAAVHWDNITNAPQFGALEWISPVLYRVLDIASIAPLSPNDGDVYVDTDDNHYYQYVDSTSSWMDRGAASEGNRIINLANADEDVYVFTSGSFVEQDKEADNSAVMVNDDGDGGEAQYVYNANSNEGVVGWKKIADIDFAGHFDGGPHKHDASEIDVENAYPNIGNSAGDDLETVLGDINTALTATNPTLDTAYDQGGPGAGRTIIVDSQAVKLDATTGTDAPLELTPLTNLPTTNLGGGQLAIKDGILYTYDSTRSKWLSVDRKFLAFGKAGFAKDQYLFFFGGSMPSNNSGLRTVRNATIISITGQIESSNTTTFSIRKNDSVTNIANLSLTATTGAGDTTLNVDLSAGDFLQCFISDENRVDYPMVIVEIAWR